jgi:hypothetical protein
LSLLPHLEKSPHKPSPKGVYGQDAGGFFIKFYLATFALVGVTSVYYFLANRGFPKACSRQDDAVGLCASGSYDEGTRTCTLDARSRFYDWFSKYR